jgi:hypothetical protein
MELEDGEEEGEGEGEVDTRTYCYCNRQSFGEMIACDEPGCEKEWVSRLLFLFFFRV